MTTPTHDEQSLLRDYLLGRTADEDVRQQLEERLMTDGEYFEALLVTEDELIDEYAQETLAPADRAQFEQHFLITPERHRKLRFAQALHRHVNRPQENELRWLMRWFVRPLRGATFFSSPVAVALALVLVTALGLFMWRAFAPRSEVAEGLAALSAAYRTARPTEARISGLAYAHFPQTRGNEQEKVDLTARDRADRILLDAVTHDAAAPAPHHALGRLYLAEKKYDQALAQLQQAVAADPNNAQLHSDLGAVLLEMGKAARAQREPVSASPEQFAQSLEHLNKALALNPSLLEARFNRALCYQYLMLPPQAAADWRKYLEQDSDSGWAVEARQNLEALERNQQRSSQQQEQLYDQFLRAYQARDEARAWPAVSQGRGRAGNFIVERLLNEYLTAATQGQDAEAESRLQQLQFAGAVEEHTVGDRFTADLARFYRATTPGQRVTLVEARGLMKSARAHYDNAELDQAITLYAQAKRLFERTGDVCEALAAESRAGFCYLRIPDLPQSLSLFGRLVVVAQEREYKALLAQSFNALADARSNRSEYSVALDYAGRTLKLSEEIQDTETTLRALQVFVARYQDFGQYRESLGFVFRALALAHDFAPDPKVAWPIYYRAALDFYWLGLLPAALEFQQEALRLALAAQWPPIISRSYAGLGLVYEKLGNYDEAIKNGQRARAVGEQMTDESARSNMLANADVQLGHLYRQAGDARQAIAHYDEAIRHYEQQSFQSYLYEAHAGKLSAFISLGDDAAAAEELKLTLALFEQYRPKILEESNRNSFFDTGQSIYDIATDFAYTRLNDPQAAFDYAETSRARSLLDLFNTDARVFDSGGVPDIKHSLVTRSRLLPDIQRQLPADTQLLQYAVLDDKLIIWVISNDRVESRARQISAPELERRTRDFLTLLHEASEDKRAETIGAGRALYDILISPVEPLLDRTKQLYIVPDKALDYLPFGALVSPATGQYLIEAYPLALAPSATFFLACSAAAQRKETTGNERLLSVGDPSFDRAQFPDLPDLPAAAREAREVAALYNSAPLIGRAAREERIVNEMQQAEVVHIASHYVVDERSPMLSRLLLAQEQPAVAGQRGADGVLQAAEVYRLKLPRTRLVVLSACQTGLERTYRGEGVISIARPFLSAGVPLVVASLWPVDSDASDATAELMIRFHQHRKQDGLSTTEALRRAQLDLLHSTDERHRQPYNWAAFVVIGGHASY
jgi:CHAT domain-containing protein